MIVDIEASQLKEWINSLDDNCRVSFFHYYSGERLVPESMHQQNDDSTKATILLVPADKE